MKASKPLNRKKTNTRVLSVRAPRSVLRAGRITSLLVFLFLGGLGYLAYTLIQESPDYVARTGSATYGIVYDRAGDILFDGTKDLKSYPAGQFADVGNLIGDTSGQMSNTLVARNLVDLANYSFLMGSQHGTASLQTTLSHSANRAIFQALGKKDGTVIACNWKTGALLVCVSKPCVDIAEGYANLATMPSGSLLCKAFYPTVPGSTQKVSTLIAAYEACGVDKVNQQQFSCTGSWLNAKGQRINCHNAKGHGAQSLSEAFGNSCNPFFAQMIQSGLFPLSAIIQTFSRMGYSVNGTPASPLVVNGIVAAPASLTLQDASDFDTQWSCLGQGDTLISPCQLMQWQTAIAAGTGICTVPYLIDSKTAVNGTVTALASTQKTAQLFSETSAQAVRTVMMENATRQYQADLAGFTCGVKSGTAQVTDHGDTYENSLLVGFCMDADCPIAFCIDVENRVNGDVTTAKIARVLLDALKGVSVS